MNDLLSSAARLYARYFGVILALILAIGFPCQLLSSYVGYVIYGKQNFIAAMQTGALIELLFGSVIAGGLLHALFIDRMGRRPSFVECLGAGVANWLQLVWTNFLMGCVIVMASILFFLPIGTWQMRLVLLIPAAFFAMRLSLSITVVMMEGEWGAAALRRSFALTRDRTWQILGLCLFIYLPVQLAGIIGIGMLQTNPAFDTWQMTALFGTLLKLLATLTPVAFFVLYEKIIADDRPVE